uniref:Uncharacterized protein n=1 Tax=Colletotrichum fructicola (strain Nara gc5) TaxID=1213859 RepID=L2G7G7_COLFN
MKLFIDFGALISVLGIGGQFTGLRGMHWLASIAQLSASIIIAFVRAVIRRYLAQPAKHETIQDPGFEMEWFILSLRNIEDAIWLPKVPPRTQLLDYIRGIFFRENRKLAAPAKPINEENTTWVILSGTTECLSWTNTESNAQSEASADLESTEDKRNATDPSKLRSQDQKPQRAYTKIEDLSSAQGVLDLRRSLGELGHWKGPAYAEALVLSQAIEAIMETFAPYIEGVDGFNCCVWPVQVVGATKQAVAPEAHPRVEMSAKTAMAQPEVGAHALISSILRFPCGYTHRVASAKMATLLLNFLPSIVVGYETREYDIDVSKFSAHLKTNYSEIWIGGYQTAWKEF